MKDYCKEKVIEVLVCIGLAAIGIMAFSALTFSIFPMNEIGDIKVTYLTHVVAMTAIFIVVAIGLLLTKKARSNIPADIFTDRIDVLSCTIFIFGLLLVATLVISMFCETRLHIWFLEYFACDVCGAKWI